MRGFSISCLQNEFIGKYGGTHFIDVFYLFGENEGDSDIW